MGKVRNWWMNSFQKQSSKLSTDFDCSDLYREMHLYNWLLCYGLSLDVVNQNKRRRKKLVLKTWESASPVGLSNMSKDQWPSMRDISILTIYSHIRDHFILLSNRIVYTTIFALKIHDCYFCIWLKSILLSFICLIKQSVLLHCLVPP